MSLKNIIRPISIGAQIPTKIPCNLSPEKNKYSETAMIDAHKQSNRMLVVPSFLIKFIFFISKHKFIKKILFNLKKFMKYPIFSSKVYMI